MIDLLTNIPFFNLLLAVTIVTTLLTVWDLIPSDYWWVRFAEFPRLQIIFITLVAWVLMVIFYPPWQDWQLWQYGVLLASIIAMGYQIKMVLPYTPLYRKQVLDADYTNKTNQIKLMVSNVLTPNNNIAGLLNLVTTNNPDILLTLESDKKWQHGLSAIESEYPYSVKIPLDNLYGMHLYSKLELINPQVKYLMVDDIPSIHSQLKLPSGDVIWLYCLHPMPPSPTEAEKSTTRDAELLVVGSQIEQQKQAAILLGDLNDVAWSKTTRTFQRISGLLDPRVGRGFINTFHAKIPVIRWALDHVFHSPCFTFVNMTRLPSIGSDHFPVLTTLQYEPSKRSEQQNNVEAADEQDHQQAQQCIKEGIKEGVKESQKE